MQKIPFILVYSIRVHLQYYNPKKGNRKLTKFHIIAVRQWVLTDIFKKWFPTLFWLFVKVLYSYDHQLPIIIFFFVITASLYGPTKRKRWTDKEKESVFSAFADCFRNQTLPSLDQIQTFIIATPHINRTSAQIKTWIHNQFKK